MVRGHIQASSSPVTVAERSQIHLKCFVKDPRRNSPAPDAESSPQFFLREIHESSTLELPRSFGEKNMTV